jgi:protein-tyrosine phosphatase
VTEHQDPWRAFLIELPYGLPGRIFRSPMPFSPYDPSGYGLELFRQQAISRIVLLAETDECYFVTRVDLPAIYRQAGFQVLHLPIPDGSVPSQESLTQLVAAIIDYAQSGGHTVIHCYAGLGRTGLVLAAIAKRLLGMSGGEAIAWVRRYIPRAIETPVQQALLLTEDPL